MTKRWHNIFGFAWLLLVLSLGLYNTQTLFVQGKVQFDLLALLPEGKTEKMRLSNKLMDDANLVGRVVIVMGHEQKDKAKSALRQFRDELKALSLPLVEEDARHIEADYKNLFVNLHPYRSGLIAQEDRQLLLNGPEDALVNRAINNIMSPFGSFTSDQITSDPFGFYPHFILSLQKNSSLSQDATGDMLINAGGKSWYVYQAHVTDKIFSLKLQEKISDTLLPVFHKISQDTGAEVLKLGGAFYAAAGAEQARSEISEIGLISTLGIVVLLSLMFKGLRPIFLALTVVSSGLVTGLAACLFFYGSIHILALVFGCSLVGVAVDYALHYYCASYNQEHGQSIDRHRIISALLPALPLGVVTSSIGYGLLVLAPFPGIQQMAILACVGLLCTFISVSLWGPYFIRAGERQSPALAQKIQQYLEKLAHVGARKYLKLTIFIVLVCVFSVGALNLKFDDNVRNFQSLNAQLKKEEDQIKSMMHFDNSSRFIAVCARDIESVLQQEEKIIEQLDKLGISYRALAELIPSRKRHQENTNLTITFSKAHFSKIVNALGGAGEFISQSAVAFEPEKFIKQLPTGWRELMDQDQVDGYTGRILLMGALDGRNIKHIERMVSEMPGVQFVDPVHEYSRLFSSYRYVMMMLSVLLLCGFTFMLAVRKGMRTAVTITTPVLLSMLATVGIMGLFGMGFSMFHAMGLILVLCIGIDYALFLYWRENPETGQKDLLLLGNALAAITTILSFGLLSLSTTTAVNSFGLTVFVGISLNFLITTLFLGRRK